MTIDWQTGQGILVADGKQLEWASFGPVTSKAPVIVMLHEGLGSLALWRDFPHQLATMTGLQIFAFSRAGYGHSEAAELPRPLDYMTREAINVLPEILGSLGDRQIILLGHSDGATIATEYAGRVQDFRVRGLILMAPHFFTEPTGLAEIANAKIAFETTDLKERMAKYHDDAEQTFKGWSDAWLDPDFEKWSVVEVLDYLRIPTLIIQGIDDQYGTLNQVREVELRSYAPVDVVVLENCSHSPHFDQANVTINEITNFITHLRHIETTEVMIT